MAIKNYNSFANDYTSLSVDNGYGGYTKSMNFLDNPFIQTRYNTNPYLKGYSYNDVNVSDLVKGYEKTLQESYLLGNDPGGRSMLDRVFDGLLVGNYVSAGLAKSAIDPNLTGGQAITNAFKAANPFGQGFRAGEYSYSGVLEDAGWKPEGTMGKIARGTVGFVGDVLLDPLTYFTGGASALLKGTGRVGRAGESLVKMSADDAAKIVEDTSRTRNIPLDEDTLRLDSEKLASEYNRLMGIRESGDGITFGAGNLPFAEKKFGKAPIVLSDDVARNIGDNTFAPFYAAARDAFYGSRIGEMFSPRTPLYRAAKEDPAKLYDFLKFTEMTQGLNVKKHDAERLIMNKVKLLNMSPYEEKQVLDLLQNKTIWEQIRPVIKLAKTEEGESLKQTLIKKREDSKSRFSELSTIKAEMDSLKQSGDDVGSELAALQKQYRDTLIDFDVKSLKSTEDIFAHNSLLRKELDELNATGKISDDIINEINSMHTLYKNSPNDKLFKMEDVLVIDQKTGKQYMSKQQAMNMDAHRLGRNEIIDLINKALYDGKRTISYAISDETLDELVKHFKTGVNKQFIRDLVDGNPRSYTGAAVRMYSYIASKMGYKSWDESYKKPYAELAQKVANRTATKEDLAQVARLDKMRLMRESMVKEFNGANSIKEVEQIIMSKENQELFNGIDNGKYTGYDTAAERRAKFVDDDAAENKKSPFAENTYDDQWTKIKNGDQEYNTLDTRVYENGTRAERAPIEVTQQNRLSMYLDIAERMNWSKKGIHTLNPRQKDIVLAIQKEIESLLPKYGANYHMLEPNQIQSLISEGVSKAIKARPDLINTVRTALHDAAVKAAEKEKKKVKMREEYAKARAEYLEKQNIETQVNERRDELLKAIEDNELTLGTHKDTRESLIVDFKQRIDDMETRVTQINKAHEELFSKFGELDGNEIRRLEYEVNRLDKALTDDDALETYMRMTLSRDDRKALHNKYSVVQTALDANKDVSDKVKEIVTVLRGDLQKIADDEVQIGKLTREQADELYNSYVPRILTAEGQKFFADQRELVDKRAGLTQDYGFGIKFSPHSKSRTVTKIELNGEWINNPTIEQLNQYFATKMGGRAYIDSISDLYLARAMKHTELMYDNDYMHNMMTTFGTMHNHGDQIKEGYKAVVNWGLLRKTLWDKAQDYRVPHGDRMVKIPADLAVEDMLKRAGISTDILEDLRTPMVELTKSQADELMRISGNFRVSQVSDSIVQKANQARKLQIAKDQSDFLRIFDKVTHLLKLNMTTVMPSFHARNKLANTYLNWLGVGREALDPKLQVQAWKAVKTQGKLTDKRVIMVNDGTGNLKAMDWNEIYHLSKTHSVIDEGFFAKDIGANTRTTGVLPRVRPKYDPTDSENFILYKKGGEIGNQIENSDRLIHFAALLKQGKTVEEAAERARQFLFDYSDLTAFEQNVMKRIIPFYTWLRKNSALQVEQLVEQPEKFRFVAKSLNGIEGMSNQEDQIDERYLNSFAQDWVQLPFMADGKPNAVTGKSKQEPILWNPNLPFQDIGRIPDPFNARDTLKELFTQSNPIMKVPVEQIANHNYFLDKEIVGKDDNQVTPRLDHILSQLALYGAAKGVIDKEGLDSALHGASTLTGIKTMTYDYNSFKQDLIKKKLAELGGQ